MRTAEEMARAWVEQLGDSAPIGVISKAYLKALESLRLADEMAKTIKVISHPYSKNGCMLGFGLVRDINKAATAYRKSREEGRRD